MNRVAYVRLTAFFRFRHLPSVCLLFALLAWSIPSEAQTTVGASAPIRIATVTITTAGALGSVSVVTQGVTGADFGFVSGGNCTVGHSYAVGDTCTVDYSFAPIAPGLRMGAVVLASASPVSVLGTTYLSDSGKAPLARVLPGSVSVAAGVSGTACASSITACGDGGPATGGSSPALLNTPGAVVADPAGNVFFVDNKNYRIREVSASTGAIFTVAGTGTPCNAIGKCGTTACTSTTATCGDGGPATSAQLDNIVGLAMDGAGNLYMADTWTNRIRKVTAATGVITTVAGTGLQCNYAACGDGGPATASGAAFRGPQGIAADGAGNLYIVDTIDARIRKVSPAGILSTVAGSGTNCTAAPCGDGGLATAAQLNRPQGVAVDGVGNLYIADTANQTIRMVASSTGLISTVAGSGTACSTPGSGCGVGGSATAASANLNKPIGVELDSAGDFYILSSGDPRLFMVSSATGLLTTVSNGVPLTSPSGLAIDGGGNLYVSDSSKQTVQKIATATSESWPGVDIDTVPAYEALSWTNIGNQSLTFSGIKLSSSNFYFDAPTTTCTSSTVLLAGAACTVGLDWTINQPVNATGLLTVTDNSVAPAGSTQAVSLSGSTQKAFGNLYDSLTTNLPPVVYANQQLAVTGTSLSGAPVFFQVLSGPATLSGTASGSQLTVGGSGASFVVQAYTYGNYTYAAASLQQTVLITPAPAPVGVTSPVSTIPVTITQAGTLGGINVSTEGLPGLDFVFAAGGTCTVGTAYTAGQTCTVNYTFKPGAPGTRLGGVVLLSTEPQVIGTAFLSGQGQGAVAAITPGLLTTIAGTGANCWGGPDCGDGGPGAAASALFSQPANSVVDPAGNLYIADAGDFSVRKLAPDGTLSTVFNTNYTYAVYNLALAGTGDLVFSSTQGGNYIIQSCSFSTNTFTTLVPASFTPALTSVPFFTIDPAGNLFFDGTSDQNIWQRSAQTGAFTLAAGANNPCPVGNYDTFYSCGDGYPAVGAASFNYPAGLALDSALNLYIADRLNNRIRKVTRSTGLISTVAGSIHDCGNGITLCGDGGPATSAILSNPYSIAIDAAGDLFIADTGNSVVRKVDSVTGIISTIAGSGPVCSYTASCGDGMSATGSTAQINSPEAISLDGSGNLFITDTGDNRIRKVSATSGPVAFISTPVGQTSTQSIALNNLGNTPLILASPTTGQSPSVPALPFRVASGATCPVLTQGSSAGSLAPGSCQEPIQFAPTVDGNYTGTLIFPGVGDFTGTHTLSVPLSATTTVPPVVPQAVRIDFYGPEIKALTATATLTATVTFTYGIVPTGGFTFAVNGGTPTAATCQQTSATTENCTLVVPTANYLPGNIPVVTSLAADAHYLAASTTDRIVIDNVIKYFRLSFPGALQAHAAVQATITPIGADGNVFYGPLSDPGSLTFTDPGATSTLTLTKSQAGPYYIANVTFSRAGNFSATFTAIGISSTVNNLFVVNTYTISSISQLAEINSVLIDGTSYNLNGLEANSTLANYGGIAVDAAGATWAVTTTRNALVHLNTLLTGGGLNAPSAVAVDGNNNIWVSNMGGNSVSVFNNSGAALNGTTGLATDALAAPRAMAIDSTGGLWLANAKAPGTQTITHLLGVAAPVITPLVNSIGAGQGVRP